MAIKEIILGLRKTLKDKGLYSQVNGRVEDFEHVIGHLQLSVLHYYPDEWYDFMVAILTKELSEKFGKSYIILELNLEANEELNPPYIRLFGKAWVKE
jgi:hypothetical protein